MARTKGSKNKKVSPKKEKLSFTVEVIDGNEHLVERNSKGEVVSKKEL